nr:spartin isoform X2 [Geotrypetes seraphini]XP_033805359.1 spartin isoform X2 [Geotrypetes seraphini]XP_033805360.1 spartin isoform X2 [Geotrypetes seraphini]XP_033805361.1 spartin isoform X2 [Geotrypetes seraphini]XP_033805362.1 spartin isoform X2 [Geotrypetes seraphini]
MEVQQDADTKEDPKIKAIKSEYKKAFMFINKGLSTDEAGYKEEAKNYYKEGQEHLLRGVSIPLQGPNCTGSDWESARQMQAKMQETLHNVNTRLGILELNVPTVPTNSAALNAPLKLSQIHPALLLKEKPERPIAPPKGLILPDQPSTINGNSPPIVNEQIPSINPSALFASEVPPAYSPQAANGHFTISYGTDSGELSLVGDEFYTKNSQPPRLESLGVDAEELILIPQGVQIFFVTPDSQVSAPSYPGYLRIVKFMDTTSELAQNRPPAFLQVCDWLYPLMNTQSPVLHCSTEVYMFPDMMSQIPGSYVGVVLSADIPAADRDLFEDLLRQMCDLKLQALDTASDMINLSERVHIEKEATETREYPEWSGKVAQGILSGASFLSWGLVKGAEYTGKAIQKGASKLREHIHPEEKPLEVSPVVTKGLHVAKQATGGAVKVSQFLVDGVCSIASYVGRELAPHVKKHGSKLIPEAIKKDKDGKSTLDGALVVAASGVQGFVAVWQGLESAAINIAKSVASETVQTVKYKYGTDAGDATDHAMNSALNVGMTALNIDHLGIKAIAKKTAKETGHAILDDYKVKEKQEKMDES